MTALEYESQTGQSSPEIENKNSINSEEEVKQIVDELGQSIENRDVDLSTLLIKKFEELVELGPELARVVSKLFEAIQNKNFKDAIKLQQELKEELIIE